MANNLAVRFRVDFGSRCSVGAGKIELLEGIARTGSLSQAARDMRMSYRRAWLLIEDMNVSFDHPVTHASVGGRGGGGVVLTVFGSRLVAGYRRLESSLQPLADTYLEDFGRHIKSGAPRRPIKSASIRRKPAARPS
jgi:molybdate transport system regulatory protein